jgi:hypothetical protein
MRQFAAAIVLASVASAAPVPAFAQFIQQGPKLADPSAGVSAEQGQAVALSADGNTAIVGAPSAGGLGGPGGGAVWVYTRGGGTWTQQGPRLVPDGAPYTSGFGESVAVSADGNTLIVGAFADGYLSLSGAAWIFVRSNGAWTQQGTKLVGTGGEGNSIGFGQSVALSADGNTALVSAPFDHDGTGATWVFVRDGGAWSQQGPKLVGTGATDPSNVVRPEQGLRVALSGDGNTALIGGQYDNGRDGAAWVFTRSGSSWTQQGPKLTASDATGPALFGQGVALSADGNTAAIGGWQDNSFVGAVWMFTRTGSTWTQQGPKLVASGLGFQGEVVSLSGDGLTLLESTEGGGAWVFRRAGSAWVQAGNRLVGSGAVGSASQGAASALSADGKTAIVGGPRDSGVLGAVWFFTDVVGDTRRASDTDGDARSEISVYNAASGVWSSLTSASGYAGATNRSWGGPAYTPVPGDYDGDGKADLAVYDESSGQWYALLSGANFTTALSKNAGGPGWAPVPGDYDGDGRTDFVVYNTTTGQWFGLTSGNDYTTTVNISFGGIRYQAVPGDFDGDGKTDIGVYDATTGLWFVLSSSSNFMTVFSANVGGTGWSPVPADYDGDGKTDFVVYNITTGQWYGLKSSTSYTTTVNINWGGAGYAPVKGDFDGDGRADLAVYVPSTGMWYILLSGSNFSTTIVRNWGGSGYAPVPGYPPIN